MKASYVLPSGNYNILLEKDDLLTLLEKGHICVTPLKHVPCTSSRALFDPDKSEMNILDKHDVPNMLMFYLDEPVADIDAGEHYVQFLTLNIEDDVLKEIKKEVN